VTQIGRLATLCRRLSASTRRSAMRLANALWANKRKKKT
jgi:hypothetical protein